MNTPLDQSLQILAEDGTVAWNADLTEDGDPADPDAAKYKDSVPTFHGFSKDGDVAGKLIYANYGRPDDYGELVGKGANFTDKIVIVRYGEILRGLKVRINVYDWRVSLTSRHRSKELRSVALSVSSSTRTLAMTASSPWKMGTLHTLLALPVTLRLWNEAPCSSSPSTPVIRPPRGTQHTKMLRVKKLGTFRTFLACLSLGRTRGACSRRLLHLRRVVNLLVS